MILSLNRFLFRIVILGILSFLALYLNSNYVNSFSLFAKDFSECLQIEVSWKFKLVSKLKFGENDGELTCESLDFKGEKVEFNAEIDEFNEF